MDRAAPVFPGIQTAQISLSSTPANVGYDHVLRLVGQNVSVALVEKGAGGAKLELPSGQVLSAQGDLPFPEQTQMQVRISFQNGAIRLQVIEAQPPSPASILAPLIQGEAAGLFLQLQSQRPPEALLPLVQMFEALFSSNEMKLQQAIDSLPPASQQLLSQMLGIKSASPPLLARAMLEQFEPTTSLLDKANVFSGKPIIFDSLLGNSEQKPNPAADASINNLRDLLLKFVESNLTKQSSATNTDNMNKTNQLLELLKPQLLPNLLPLPKETIQSSPKESSIADNLEKLMLALKLLPDDARNNLSNNIVGRPNSDIETIAKAIFDKLGANIEKIMVGPEKGLLPETEAKEALPKIIQALDKMPAPVRREIALALVGAAGDEPKNIAEALVQKILSLSLDKNSFSKMDAAPSAIRQLLASLPTGARQALAEALDGAGFEVGGHTNAGSKPGPQSAAPDMQGEGTAPKPTHQGAAQAQEPHLAATSAKPAPQGAAQAAATGSKPAIHGAAQAQEPPPAATGSKAATHGAARAQEPPLAATSAKPAPQAQSSSPLASGAPKQGMQKLVQAVENLPLFIRRALASAVMNDAGAEPEAIAEFLAQKGLAPAVKHDIAHSLETAPPLLRQVITLFAGLPIDARPEQMTETLLNGDKAILDAVKALLSMDEDADAAPAPLSGRQIPAPLQNKESAAPSGEIKNSYLTSSGRENTQSAQFASRLGYLLQFEALGAQNTFPAEAKNSLASWFNSIVDIFFKAKAQKTETAETRQTEGQHKPSAAHHAPASPARARNISQGAPPPRAANLPPEQSARLNEAPLEKPQTWQTWIKDSIQALIDPRVSAKESVFHALAAKEGVNYFELPLPWMPDRQMEIWVETDTDGDDGLGGSEKESHRILLALNFTVLGETRVGIESAAKRLNIKIWAERPHFVENEAPRMQNELSALGFDIQVSIQPLVSEHGGVAPSIKSLIVGSSLHAVG